MNSFSGCSFVISKYRSRSILQYLVLQSTFSMTRSYPWNQENPVQNDEEALLCN